MVIKKPLIAIADSSYHEDKIRRRTCSSVAGKTFGEKVAIDQSHEARKQFLDITIKTVINNLIGI